MHAMNKIARELTLQIRKGGVEQDPCSRASRQVLGIRLARSAARKPLIVFVFSYLPTFLRDSFSFLEEKQSQEKIASKEGRKIGKDKHRDKDKDKHN